MKKQLKRILCLALATGMLATAFAGCGKKPTGGDSASGSEPQSKKLVIYSPNSEGIMNNIIPAFEAKTGITCEIISAGAGELTKRLLSEANDPYADINFGGVNYSIYMQNPDLYQEYVSPNDKNLPEEYQNKTGFYTNYTLNGSCLLINPEMLNGVTVEGYADLLKPELKGKIATGDPANSSSAFAQLTNALLAMGGYEDDGAWKYMEDLIKNWDGKVLSSSSAVYKGVAEGEYAVGMTYEDPCVSLLESGAKVEVVYPTEGAVFLPSGVAIVNGAKNLENAKLFVDFLISEECQQIFGEKLTNRPILAQVKPKNLPSLDDVFTIEEDIPYIAEHKNDITSRYKDLFAALQ